jgi:hypothetical protein
MFGGEIHIKSESAPGKPRSRRFQRVGPAARLTSANILHSADPVVSVTPNPDAMGGRGRACFVATPQFRSFLVQAYAFGRRAVYALAKIDHPKARDALTEIARDNPCPPISSLAQAKLSPTEQAQ